MTEPAIPSAVMRPERSLLRGLKMIGWAFLGIRKRTDSQDDLARVSPDLAGDAKISNRFKNQSLIWDYFGDAGERGKLGVACDVLDLATLVVCAHGPAFRPGPATPR